MKLLIKNGLVITERGREYAEILIEGGKIAAIGQKISGEYDRTLDATGLYILPGAIDAHTHLEMPMSTEVGMLQSADSYFTGTMAAACGGVTTLFDYVTPNMDEGLIHAIKRRDSLLAPSACVDYCYHNSVVQGGENLLNQLAKCVEIGVTSFKAYMIYDFGVDDDTLLKTLRRCGELGVLLGIHAEDRAMVEELRNRLIAEGKTTPWHHYESRPEAAECKAVENVIALAKLADAPVYIVHLACEGGMKAVCSARAKGQRVYAETCPQYLHFTNQVYKRADGQNFICSPPMKGEASQAALWGGIAGGDIQTVATDHCPFQSFEKAAGREDFTKAPNGCMGVENLYPYMLNQANKGIITFEKAIALCSTNVAKLFGLSSRKGDIKVGLDADLVLYDPNLSFTISQSSMHSSIDYTIWEGVELHGYPVMTLLRGEVVFDRGKFTGKQGNGKFVPCDLPIFI